MNQAGFVIVIDFSHLWSKCADSFVKYKKKSKSQYEITWRLVSNLSAGRWIMAGWMRQWVCGECVWKKVISYRSSFLCFSILFGEALLGFGCCPVLWRNKKISPTLVNDNLWAENRKGVGKRRQGAGREKECNFLLEESDPNPISYFMPSPFSFHSLHSVILCPYCGWTVVHWSLEEGVT